MREADSSTIQDRFGGMGRMKISIVGIGYIGLPTAVMFASGGHQVVGMDLNRKAVDALNQGKIIIEEPHLDEAVAEAVKSGNLRASMTVEPADVYIICVPTPILPDHSADMRAVRSAAESLLPVLKKGDTVILESTSPPGTTRDLIVPILAGSGLDPLTDLQVAYCPERVLPGRILIEMKENNRIVGGLTETAAAAVRDLYRSFVAGDIFLTDATTAEMTKLMENTYRDVNIALANELAKICEQTGVNAWDVIAMANRHPRVHLHQPGPGVGGHCIAVDPWFIVEKQPELARMIALARRTNDGMPQYVRDQVRALLPEPGGRVCVLGVTYKPDVDDMRESPIIELISELRQLPGVEVVVSDPHVDFEGSNLRSIEEAATGADLMLLAVNHKEFRAPDFFRLAGRMRNAVVLDTRNFWSGEQLENKGFAYHLLGMGRKPS